MEPKTMREMAAKYLIWPLYNAAVGHAEVLPLVKGGLARG